MLVEMRYAQHVHDSSSKHPETCSRITSFDLKIKTERGVLYTRQPLSLLSGTLGMST